LPNKPAISEPAKGTRAMMRYKVMSFILDEPYFEEFEIPVFQIT